jgi:hypothetical protein
LTFSGLHDVISQKLEHFITTTVGTSDPINVVGENFYLMGVRWVNFCVYVGLCFENRSRGVGALFGPIKTVDHERKERTLLKITECTTENDGNWCALHAP